MGRTYQLRNENDNLDIYSVHWSDIINMWVGHCNSVLILRDGFMEEAVQTGKVTLEGVTVTSVEQLDKDLPCGSDEYSIDDVDDANIIDPSTL